MDQQKRTSTSDTSLKTPVRISLVITGVFVLLAYGGGSQGCC